MAEADVVGNGAVVTYGELARSMVDPPLLTTRPTLAPLSALPIWVPFHQLHPGRRGQAEHDYQHAAGNQRRPPAYRCTGARQGEQLRCLANRSLRSDQFRNSQ
jgi:hypothetical protein